LVLLVAGAVVDEHRTDGLLDEQTAHAELNTIALVGLNAALPKRLRNDAEHGAAVEPLPAGLNRVNAPAPQLSRFDEWLWNHAVVSSDTAWGIAGGRRRRRRRTPGVASAASRS